MLMAITTFWTWTVVLLALAAVPATRAADDDNEFILNVFSDVGPILALFGEQFARQFLSETFTIFDYLIFACVPLGIITALAGAIRVQGPSFAKAFIGRARENRAAAELELMSSTSSEVCELYNGSGIVRVVGRPQLEQLLLFPEYFNDLDGDKNCGIHTLKTTVSENCSSMRAPQVYHSRHAVRLPSTTNEGLHPGFNEDQKDRRLPLGFLGPPNLQLNISSSGVSHTRQAAELLIATIISICLQSALLVFAAVTVLNEQTMKSIPSEHEPWGLPRYIVGSVLLSLGTFSCSVAIEKGTKEFLWQALPVPSSPHTLNTNGKPLVFWIQGLQRVSDQNFKSCVVFGGPKEYLLTSNRREEVERYLNESFAGADPNRPRSGEDTHRPYFQQVKNILPFSLQSLTIVGTLMGAVGFTVQFIGLRGLPWPCAILQLLAIFCMACVRAWVRRRIGRPPSACDAWPGYELDFLATQLVFNQNFRNLMPDTNHTKAQAIVDDLLLRWRVKTAQIIRPGCDEFIFHNISEGAIVRPALQSSQRLMLVRQRLGELCKWPQTAPRAARALKNSIERFLNDFHPNHRCPIEWNIPAVFQKGMPGHIEDSMTLLLDRKGSKWNIELGEIEAIISLWVANIQMQKRKKSEVEKSRDWRVLSTSLSHEAECCMIIGYEGSEDLLSRDMKWWARSEVSVVTSTVRDSADDEGRVIIGFTGPHQDKSQHQWGRSGHRPTNRLLLRFSQRELTEIAAQHLFISFIWLILDYLPKDFLHQKDVEVQNLVPVQRQSDIDLLSTEDGKFKPALGHPTLSNFAQYAQKEGLGSSEDVLCCMIPPFSFEYRLPNEAILDKLFPQDVLHGETQEWVKLSPKYIQLLMKTEDLNSTTTKSRLTVTGVVMTMEYIYLMAMEYSAVSPNSLDADTTPIQIDMHHETRKMSPWRARWSDFDTLIRYVKSRFHDILYPLLPVYRRQRRATIFEKIFNHSGTTLRDLRGRWNPAFLHLIGFTSLHQKICDKAAVNQNVRLDFACMLEQDIFGWTPLHYAAVRPDLRVQFGEDVTLSEIQKLPQWHNRLNQSPLHLAAASGNRNLLDQLLAGNPPSALLSSAGIDGMSALHLAIDGQHQGCVESLLRKDKRASQKQVYADKWGRSPLHIAVKARSSGILNSLLEYPDISVPEDTDIFGKTPLSYLDEREEEDRVLGGRLLERWTDFTTRDFKQHTFLHHAIKFQQWELIQSQLSDQNTNLHSVINDADSKGRSPLHLAVETNNVEFVGTLLKNNGKASNKDYKGRTPMIIACRATKRSMVEAILEKERDCASACDHTGRSALHYLLAKESSSTQELRDMIPKLTNIITDYKIYASEASDNASNIAALLQRLGDLRSDLQRLGSGEEQIAHDVLKIAVQFALSLLKDRVDEAYLEHITVQVDKVEQGLNKALRELTKAVPLVDIRDERNQTPLHYAIIHGNPWAATLLLENSANPGVEDDSGNNALEYLAMSEKLNEKLGFGCSLDSLARSSHWWSHLMGKLEQMSALRADSKPALVTWAIKHGKDHIASFLYSKEVQGLFYKKYEETALILACRLGICPQFVDQIVKSSDESYINHVDGRYGQSALAWACGSNSIEMATLLLNADGINPNQEARYIDYTPLHFALAGNNTEIVELLLDHRDIEESWGVQADDGLTPLEFAIRRCDEYCLRTLLFHNKVRAQGLAESTVSVADLKGLVFKKEDPYIRRLAFGAWMIRVKDVATEGQYPFHALAEKNQLSDMDHLLETWAGSYNKFRFDQDNWTPIDTAKRHGHNDLADCIQTWEDKRGDLAFKLAYREPSTFTMVGSDKGLVQNHDEHPQHPARGPVSVHVTPGEIHEERYYSLRTEECIPPNVSNFYYEVKMIACPNNKQWAMGFCHSSLPTDSYPGRNKSSWAYDGSIGDLLCHPSPPTDSRSGGDQGPRINDESSEDMSVEKKWEEEEEAEGEGKSKDFRYGEGDVVGCGLDMETGDGFCTLNGKRLDFGDKFYGVKLKAAKIYPCLAFAASRKEDVLKVRVNWGRSAEHPFLYNGGNAQEEEEEEEENEPVRGRAQEAAARDHGARHLDE